MYNYGRRNQGERIAEIVQDPHLVTLRCNGFTISETFYRIPAPQPFIAPIRNLIPIFTIPISIGVIGIASLLGETSVGSDGLDSAITPNRNTDYRPWGKFGPVDEGLSTAVAAEQQANPIATT